MEFSIYLKKLSVKKGTLWLRWVSSPGPSDAFDRQSKGPGLDTQRSESVPFFTDIFFQFLIYFFNCFLDYIISEPLTNDRIGVVLESSLLPHINTNMSANFSTNYLTVWLESWVLGKNSNNVFSYKNVEYVEVIILEIEMWKIYLK